MAHLAPAGSSSDQEGFGSAALAQQRTLPVIGMLGNSTVESGVARLPLTSQTGNADQ